ncbi:MAG TPA: carboxypeptidase-like regulatory domain-containing protein [Haliscomenobacter sp.]|uniref:carboxypeptidase-like regulatory domain-containing protein n=1 Tax=Haliscomenobacter sp. TaxID=2717303 RepID=UPI002CDFAB14|nr:carboxypeptidase-like regulatory domain-containing protein [Haliscomenobacter sp.]HOY16935.1 carboxypeptidase-like regulatory domain-containing protein [Haliscomenobacter sp.]
MKGKLLPGLMICCLLAVSNLFGQEALDRVVSISFEDQSPVKALLHLRKSFDLNIVFSDNQLPRRNNFPLSFQEQSIRLILDAILANTGLSYRTEMAGVVVTRTIPTLKWRSRFTIQGMVETAGNAETLNGANVFALNQNEGTHSNEQGVFSLSLLPGPTQISISFVGFRTDTLYIDLRQDTFLRISLQRESQQMEAVVIPGTPEREGMDFGHYNFDLEQLQRMPKIGGETDLIRAVQMLPGVQTGPDGVGGVFVRGGEAGHNLVIIDDVPVYNFNHAAGVLSVFNTSIVKSAELLKGAFPARYSGRLSSVLDVRMRDGNKEYWTASGELGLVSGRLTVEGPIVKNKSSLLLAGRASLLNWVLRPYSRQFKSRKGEEGESSYAFYDFNAKFNVEIGKKDRLFFSFYRGQDDFGNQGDSQDTLNLLISDRVGTFRFRQVYREKLYWTNTGGSLRWSHILNKKLFANTTLTFSELNVNIATASSDTVAIILPIPSIDYDADFGNYSSSIRDLGARTDFHWDIAPGNKVRFGLRIQRNHFVPGIEEYDDDYKEYIPPQGSISRTVHTTGWSLYVENERRFFARRLYCNYGLNVAGWNVDKKNYAILEPRVAISYLLADSTYLEASVSRMSQFLHLLSGTNIGLPTDLWVPSTGQIGPELSWQYTLGIRRNLWRGWNLGIEGYFKQMKNLVNYSEGANFLDDWEQNITVGSGRAYGLDMMLRKDAGRINGYIAYTLGRTDRIFPKINLGERYPFKYDHRHDFKIWGDFRFSSKVDLSASWVFSSGLAFSLPQDAFTVEIPGVSPPVTVIDFGPKNSSRLPAYHRFDIGLNLHFFSKKGIAHHFQFGAYNAYSRRNPLYYQLRTIYVEEDGRLKEEKVFTGVHLLPFLPSINYSVKF